MFGLLTDAVTLLFSTFIPTFLTYKALSVPPSQQTPNNALHPWLTYWITNSLLLSFPRILPFDSYLRLGAHIYLLVPGRAEAIYQSYIRPWLQEHEATIEETVSDFHDKVKVKLWDLAATVRDAFAGILGGSGEAQRREAEAKRLQAEREKAAGGSYVQNLLARWSTESRVEQSAADAKYAGAAGRETTLATKFGSLVSAAATAGLEHASSAVNAATAKPQSPAQSPSQSRAVSSGADTAQARLSEGLSSIAAGLSDMKKSRSETDFERIEQEDAPTSELSPASKARWGWWGSSTAPPASVTQTATSGRSTGIDASGA